jgi:peptidoglycan hydrolase CwlO-like protein
LPNFSGFALPSNSEGGRRGFIVFAQEDCKTKEECEALLKKYEEEIKKLEGAIGKTEQEQRTIQNQINALRSTIQKLDLQIQQGNIMIKDLSYQIKDTEGSIEQTSLKIEDSRAKLAAILQIIYEEDQTSIIEVLLSNANLSDFFDNLMALETLNLKSQEFLGEIKNLKQTLEGQKQSLDTEKGDLEKVVKIQASQKQQSQATRGEQEYFLKLTEAQKQQYLKEKEAAEKSAAEIRARLFQLIGIPDIHAPTFGEALQIADAVTRVVKIRPAFLLGVISAESALGRNVGQCYITNSQTGGGVYITTGNPINRIIHPTRDLPIFLRLTGDNFSKTPVSCWIPMCSAGAGRLSNNVSIDSAGNIICPAGYGPWGFGGAMGPAQFIPSTWLLYEGKITSLFGISSPNPWNVYDSFAASSLYLYELGAGQKTLAAESNAANRYSGGYSWYASDVMKRASCIQDFIDKGTMSSACQQLTF